MEPSRDAGGTTSWTWISLCLHRGARWRESEQVSVRPNARARRVASVASSPYLASMNGTKRDIDPASELLEEDEEQALPESEQDIDLAAAGPLAVGRAVIANHAKLAPSSPGVYRMIDAK